MDAIKLLKSQHRDVEKIFAEIEGLSDRAIKSRQRLFERLADALAVHATIEEKIFYPGAHFGDSEDMLLEALEEHLSLKRVISDLMSCAPEDETWKAKLTVLKEYVQHHVKEEEKEMFPLARKHLGAERLEELGAEMETMAMELEKSSPRKNVPAETEKAAPLL